MSIPLRPATVRALRTSGPFTLFTASWLHPDTDRWAILDDHGVVLGGRDPARVAELARRYRLIDAFLARHGRAPFDQGRAAGLLPQVVEEREAQRLGLDYALLPSGRRRLRFRLPRMAAGRLRGGPLDKEARKLGVSIRLKRGLATVSGRVWKEVLHIAAAGFRGQELDFVDGHSRRRPE